MCTTHHPMPTSNDHEEEGHIKHCGKRRCDPPFPSSPSTFFKPIDFSSGVGLNLDKAKSLSFGTDLKQFMKPPFQKLKFKKNHSLR